MKTTTHDSRRASGTGPEEWRCVRCGKLLGLVREGRVHIRFAGGHQYVVGFPATGACRRCGTLNEVSPRD